ncbi:MAG: hypothetical protein IMZ46_02240 [Acidobacteria bacterium]|nr:hypothetical protein [Acidobacteriota bacterium]
MDEKGSRQHVERRAQFARAIPDALVPAGRLLYIGGKPGRLQMLDLYLATGWKVDILEAWHENAEALKHWPGLDPKVAVFEGDIRALTVKDYDSVVWWHGPEHIAATEFPAVLRRIERATTRMVILASPWGRYDQGPAEGNPFEEHLWAVYPEALWALGYETDAIGAKDRKGSNLLAWKRMGR